ncbi:transporter substrate-binding domain-containing protein [Parapusillimonas granuli]|uniref:Transporter substrate-binding domain-containing protein n=1 Tax=Parapusillimonas granuli TaxID=380911 RepID=A0A853FXQ9_9BURK|nr:transporter substrate-binding domain-containing protein [Parapusillimonas granuli]MBB5213624.1 polar amino acid transport system substrate-binding protein [Parapusillimonas granuli]MEB2398717.1 transporter substrate-binding domain-containing protein [Alcaligenaceae bacterium]NYT48462.1 transporter substrate-binding domain-containing protein [Parapusillimonas granuli]
MFVLENVKKIAGAALLAGCAALTLGAAPSAAETIDDVKQKGELTVGMLVDFPPYGILNAQNKPDGYDADVAKQLAKDLGVKVNIVPVTGPNRIPFLLTNKVDMLVASLAITPERAKQVQFSDPYSAAQIVMFGGKDRKIGKPEDLSGLRIGVARASTQDIAVTKVAPKDANIRRFDDDASAMQALLSGQVDAIGCSTTVAAQISQRAPNRFENKFVLLQQEMAVAMRPGEPNTLKAVNEAVAKNIQNGEFSKLFEKWLGTPLPELKKS